MSNILIVDTSKSTSDLNSDVSILAYKSTISTSTYTGEDEDPDFPFINALDYRDNTKYSPIVEDGTIEIYLSQGLEVELNYFSFAVHNGQDAGLTGKIEVDTGTGYQVVSEFSGIVNNRPFLAYFESKSTRKQRITLNFTSKLYIGSMNLGNAHVFNRAPSLGFQPGRTASLDTVEQFTTEGNNFIVGRRVNRGFKTKGEFKYIEFTSINDWYPEYMEHVLNSKTLYFKWNSNKDEVVYGVQNPKTLAPPTYSTSFHSDFSFEINGYA